MEQADYVPVPCRVKPRNPFPSFKNLKKISDFHSGSIGRRTQGIRLSAGLPGFRDDVSCSEFLDFAAAKTASMTGGLHTTIHMK